MKAPAAPQKNRPFDAVTFGYNSCDWLCVLDGYPAPDGKTPMRAFARQGGGQAATAAAALARLGFRVRYLGKFGDTPEGEFARASLVAEGVDTGRCRTAAGTQNQLAVIWIDRQAGTRAITFLRETGLDIAPGEFAPDLADAGLLLLDGHHLPAAARLAEWARSHAVPVLLDVGRAQPGIEDLLDLTDYVLCDARFPAEYLGEGDPSRSLRAIAERHRTPLVAMTLGARGSLAWVDGRAVATPAFAVDVADTTGAGDVWHAGFAAGLLWDLPLEEILRVAAGAAAMSCTKVGGRAGAPTRAELETFLRTARTC